MCLAVPGKIVSIDKTRATVDFGGITRSADLSLLSGAKIGDYVLIHVGFAIQKVDERVAREQYRLMSEMEASEGDGPVAQPGGGDDGPLA